MADIHVPLCSIVAIDSTSICYRVCGSCERVLPADNTSHGHNVHPCDLCRRRPRNPCAPTIKHLYKLLISVATVDCAIVVVAFDRAARTLFGCTADEFLDFATCDTSAAEMVSKVLEGEMVSVVLRPPKGGYGQHLRAVSIVPVSSSFQPVITVLSKLHASAPRSLEKIPADIHWGFWIRRAHGNARVWIVISYKLCPEASVYSLTTPNVGPLVMKVKEQTVGDPKLSRMNLFVYLNILQTTNRRPLSGCRFYVQKVQ